MGPLTIMNFDTREGTNSGNYNLHTMVKHSLPYIVKEWYNFEKYGYTKLEVVGIYDQNWFPKEKLCVVNHLP